MSQPNRFDYVKYDTTAIAKQEAFKKKCLELEELVKTMIIPGDRTAFSYADRSPAWVYAFKSLEEFYMWVGKAIRDEQVELRRAELQEGRTNS